MKINFNLKINAGNRCSTTGDNHTRLRARGTMKIDVNLAGIAADDRNHAVSLWHRSRTVRGHCLNPSLADPVVRAAIKLYDPRPGTKYQLKTNSKGQYYSVGISLGTYTVTLLQNGNPIDEHGNAVIEASGERVVDFDLAKDNAVTEEQRQKAEAAQKSTEKLKGLNALEGVDLIGDKATTNLTRPEHGSLFGMQ